MSHPTKTLKHITYKQLIADHDVEHDGALDHMGDDNIVNAMPGWTVSDGHSPVPYPAAETAKDAAREYVCAGDWGDTTTTIWVHVTTWRVARVGDMELRVDIDHHCIAVDPDEPACVDKGSKHDWQSPHDIVDGTEENPGVCGHGGGVIVRTVCARCGRYRIVDTWAQDPETGKQGLRSIEYMEPDDQSLAWIEYDESDNPPPSWG